MKTIINYLLNSSYFISALRRKLGIGGGMVRFIEADRPLEPREGQLYYNSTTHVPEYWNGTEWVVSGTNAMAFTALSGTTWDGSHKYTTLTGNTALTLDTERDSGILYVKQDATGSRTLSINGQSLSIASAANADTTVSFVTVNGQHVFSLDTAVVAVAVPAPDVTAPTIVSVEAIDANTLRFTFSEDMNQDGTVAGIEADNGAPLTLTGITWNSGTEADVTTDEAMTDADTITYAYAAASGDLEDEAGNALADDSGSVTNSIPAVGGLEDATLVSTASTLNNSSGVWTITGGSAAYGHLAKVNKTLPAGDPGKTVTQYQPTAGDVFVGWVTTGAETGYNSIPWGFLINRVTAELNYLNGGTFNGTGHTLTAGELIMLDTTGGDVSLQTSTNGGSSWTVRFDSYTYDTNSDTLTPVADFYGPTGKLYHPQTEGFA